MPDLDHERQFNAPVIGIDEAGRGPWAGPVTVTASIEVAQIDQMGILKATFAGMVMAASELADKMVKAGWGAPVHALVDGNLLPPDMPLPATALIKGDSRSLSIVS